jgi:hypothetical protein
MANKAHSATLRRLSKRYDVQAGQAFDLTGGGLSIEVETAATLVEGVRKLQRVAGRCYVAMTNQESLADALLLTAATDIGVMNSRGDVIKEAGALAGEYATGRASANLAEAG